MEAYLRALRTVYEQGEMRSDRTSVGLSAVVSGVTVCHDLREGFPVLTTKKLWWKGAFHELFWLLSGKTDLQYLHDHKVHYWDNWAVEGDVGPTYGFQWRHFGSLEGEPSGGWPRSKFGVDQLGDCIELLRAGPPYSRRMVVTAWNPRDIRRMLPGQLPPCHILYQFIAVEDMDGNFPPSLDLCMYQRSCDMFLGVPFDIVLYALLLELVAHSVGMTPRYLNIMLADAHIYDNHFDVVRQQLRRHPLCLPRLQFVNRNQKDIDNYTIDDIDLLDYRSHPALKGDVAL